MAAATVEEILTALNAYTDYDRVGSVDRAWEFVIAARQFLQLPSSSSEQGSSLGHTPASVQSQLDAAMDFIRANTGRGRTAVQFLSVRSGYLR